MAKKIQADSLAGILSRLLKDDAGNTLAMTAAAMLPLLGMVGGAVDMSRTYAVKSKLQSACDAGVLAGLKVVAGNWNENNDSIAGDAATTMFNANFKDGAWGSENTSSTFTWEEKKASADVPMTIMKVFGREKTTVSVECSGELQLPNADIMFVLDNTGSMDDPIPGDSTNTRKIDGLKVGVNCFYEILARQDNPDVTNEQCDYTEGEEPWTQEVDESIQLRFGFVPYDQMVNVGFLLSPKDFVDTAEYQTRVPTITDTFSWSAGTATTSWNNNWTPATTPIGYYTRQSSSGWSDQSSDVSTQQGTLPYVRSSAINSTACNGYNNLAGSSSLLAGLSESGSSISTNIGTNFAPAAPVHPQVEQTTSSTQSQTITVTQWRYIWEKRGNTTSCFLERRNHSTTYPRSQTGATSRPLTWTPRQVVTSWTYKKHPIDVRGFKNENSFNTSINLPLNDTSVTATLSGQSSSSTFKVLANRTINWTGCIEERQTHRVVDGDPSDDYNPIPEDAYDLFYDMGTNENDDATRWRFALRDASWGRTSGGNRTLNPVVGTSSMSQNFGWSCPVPARKLTEYSGEQGAKNFADYVDTLAPGGNTYHDIGLLWGARLLSAGGIFSSENRSTRNSGVVRRHMVFMTDGETYNSPTNYTSYGIDWYDRRQTDTASAPTSTLLQNNNDARSKALCSAIKTANSNNEVIELWVIYYGVPDTGTALRLKNCATDNAHFIIASNTQVLVTAFKNVAKKIAELQLTE